MLVRREPLVRRRGIAGAVVCGVMWLAAYNVLLNAAEPRHRREPGRRGAVCWRGGRLRRRRRRPKAGAAPWLCAVGHLAGLHDRRRRVPAVRAVAGH
jgi:hypothetical protein